jgi:hypothetical protein
VNSLLIEILQRDETPVHRTVLALAQKKQNARGGLKIISICEFRKTRSATMRLIP